MFCPNCGKEVPEGANNCPNCGASLKEYANYSTGTINDGNQTIETNDINNNQTNNKIVNEGKNGKIASFLTLLATVLFLSPYLLQKNQFLYNNFFHKHNFSYITFILSITILVYVRIKYPSNKLSKILLIIFIVLAFLSILMTFLTMLVCFGSVLALPSFIESCKNCPG